MTKKIHVELIIRIEVTGDLREGIGAAHTEDNEVEAARGRGATTTPAETTASHEATALLTRAMATSIIRVTSSKSIVSITALVLSRTEEKTGATAVALTGQERATGMAVASGPLQV